MILNYTFKDPHSGIQFKNPDGLNELFSQEGDKLYSLQANNGKGKSWLMTFIISSLVEFPERMKSSPSPLLVMTDELLAKVQELRKYSSGNIKGELQIGLGSIQIKIEYKYGEPRPTRCFAPKDDPDNWSDLDDSILSRHARFCYLIPENPTKRIQGIKTNIQNQLTAIKSTQLEISLALKDEFRENTSDIRNADLIKELDDELIRARREKEDKRKKLELIQENHEQFIVLENLKELRMALMEHGRIETVVKKLKGVIKEMPKIRTSQEEQEILQKWNDAKRAVDSSPLANVVRFISKLGEEEFNDFGNFQNQYVSELDEVNQLCRLNDCFELQNYDSNPFLNSDQQSLSKYRKILTGASLTSDIVNFFTKITAISTEEQEGLAAIKELINWLEKRAHIADHLLRDKLRLNVSSQRLLSLLQDEERKMAEQEKLNQLAREVDTRVAQIPIALEGFDKLKKEFLKAQKNYDEVNRDSSAAEREKQMQKREEFRDLQRKLVKTERNISERRTYVSNKAPMLKTGTVAEINASITQYTRQNPKSSKGVATELQEHELKYKQQAIKVRELHEKLAFESNKSESSFTPAELETLKIYVDLRLEFSKFCTNAINLFSESTPTPYGDKIRELFGDVAKKQLGGEILFDGVKRKLISVDFNSESLIYADTNQKPIALPWNRLSTGNSAALFLNSTLYNVIQENKTVVALIDEVGDMTSDSRQQAFQSVRQNSSKFALFMTAEPKEGEDFEITPLK